MSTQILPFAENRPCTKCECPVTSTRHIAEVDISDAVRSILILRNSIEPYFLHDWPPDNRPEHLLRTCARCGFPWREQTADATGKATTDNPHTTL